MSALYFGAWLILYSVEGGRAWKGRWELRWGGGRGRGVEMGRGGGAGEGAGQFET